MTLQRAGLATVLFCTSPFLAMARTILRSLGDPGVRLVEVEHPLGGLERDQVQARAAAIYEQIDRLVWHGEAADG